MKAKSKKILAIILATLMVTTSLPFSTFADSSDRFALETAIADYESTMDGTVYEDMKDAYLAYAKAKEYLYAYDNGEKSDLDLRTAADDLSSKTNLMATKKWTPVKGTANASFVDDSEDTDNLYSGNNTNLLYTEAATSNLAAESTDAQVNEKGSGEHRVTVQMYYPKTVMLYDGETDPVMPVVSLAKITKTQAFTQITRYVYSIYPYTPTTSNPNAADPNFSMKNELWVGANGTTDRNVNWVWTMQQDNGYPATYAVSGTNDELPNKLQLSSSGAVGIYSYYWASLANSVKYTGGDDAFGNAYYTENYLSWRRFTGGDGADDYMGFTGGTTPIYVINYKALRTAIDSVAAIDVKNTLKDKADYTALLGAIDDATDYDPNDDFANSNALATNVTAAATAISEKVSAINTAKNKLSTADLSDYDALATAIENTKATYTADNADGTYTEDSFSAFKTAYTAAVADAAKVATDGFTSTSATDLNDKYSKLNRVPQPSGNAGDTSYNYDSESGKVEITGPGSTGNYTSGAESPLGNSDNIKEVVVGEDVTEIGANTFAGDNNLETIYVPAGATYGEGAFDGCTKLRNVIIYGGEVKNASAANAPWNLPSVKVVKLGKDETDYSVTSIGENVFEKCENTAFYFYYADCDIPDELATTLGTKPTIYGYEPSSAKAYYDKFAKDANNMSFVSLGHDHVWVPTVHAPTCTASGYTSYKCKYCDETKPNDTFVSALGHDFVDVDVPASCTERGYTERTCSRCDYNKKINYTAKAAHTYDMSTATPAYTTGEERNDSTQYRHIATCTTCGAAQTYEYCQPKESGTVTVGGVEYIKFECATCKGTYHIRNEAEEGKHLVIYQGLENEIISTETVSDGAYPVNVPTLPSAPTGHVYEWRNANVTVNPAETAITSNVVFVITDVVSTYTVTYRDENEGFVNSEVVAYNASPSAAPELPKTAQNVGEEGHRIYVWQLDGTTVEPTELTVTSDITIKRALVTVEHNFTDTIITPATCAKEGEMSRYCDDCGFMIEGAEITKLEHKIVTVKKVDATCTKAGKTEGSYCSECGEVFVVSTTIPAKGHKWNAGVVTKEPTPYETGIRTYTCTVCGAKRNEVLPKVSIAEITPSEAAANKAKVNKTIRKPSGIITVSNSKKKQMTVSFTKVPSAQNYRVMFRKAGTKKWTYFWTQGKTEFVLKNLKKNGLYEFCFAAYKKNAKGVWERGPYSSTSYRYYYKATQKKLKAGKKKMTVSWKADKNANGYEIVYSTTKKYSNGKRVKVGKSTTSKTIKKLKKGKTYYVWVRALKKKGGKTYTGEYSTKKKIKIK